MTFKKSPKTTEEFFKVMKDFHEKKITLREMVVLITKLFKGQVSLLLGFNLFLPPGDTLETIIKEKAVDGVCNHDNKMILAIQFVSELKKRLNNESFSKFLEILRKCQKDKESIENVYKKFYEIFGNNDKNKDLENKLRQYLPIPEKDEKVDEMKVDGVKTKKKKKLQKPIVVVNVSPVEEFSEKKHVSRHNYGPSYKLCEKKKSYYSGRTGLCYEVLNDVFVSRPAGREFEIHKHKNSMYENSLFSCEDDRCEMDIIVYQTYYTLLFLTPFVERIKEKKRVNFVIENLKAIHKSCIARIYSHDTSIILEGLDKHSERTIPILYNRLQQKWNELKTVKRDLNVFWSYIYKNASNKIFQLEKKKYSDIEARMINRDCIIRDLKLRTKYSNNYVVSLSNKKLHDYILNSIIKYGSFSKEEVLKIKQVWGDFIVDFFDLRKNKKDGSKKSLFYGNENDTFLLRFYFLFYEKLRKAKFLGTLNKNINSNISLYKRDGKLHDNKEEEYKNLNKKIVEKYQRQIEEVERRRKLEREQMEKLERQKLEMERERQMALEEKQKSVPQHTQKPTIEGDPVQSGDIDEITPDETTTVTVEGGPKRKGISPTEEVPTVENPIEEKPIKETPVGVTLDEETKAEDPIEDKPNKDKPVEEIQIEEKPSEVGEEEDEEEIDIEYKGYETFLYQLYDYLGNVVEEKKFQKILFKIFGFECYTLFNVKTIFMSLILNLKTVLQDEKSKDLRSVYVEKIKEENVYYEKCLGIVGSDVDLYKFENDLEKRKITVTAYSNRKNDEEFDEDYKPIPVGLEGMSDSYDNEYAVNKMVL